MLDPSFPTQGPARDAAILSAVQAGQFEAPWGTVTSTANGHTATFRVFADALKVGGVRLGVSAFLQQQIADVLGCLLLTPKLSDLMWAQRVATLPPFPQPVAAMASTATMVHYSATIDAALAQLGNPQGIVATVGKNWVLSNGLLKPDGRPALKATGRPAAMNYGFAFQGTFQGQTFDPCASGIPNCRVIQGRGTAHDLLEVDYSQICQLVDRACVVDGVTRDLADVLRDPDLSALVSSEGPLRLTRQPGVPVVTPPSNEIATLEKVGFWTLGSALVPTDSTATGGVWAVAFGLALLAASGYAAYRLLKDSGDFRKA